jgi:preprotein translocase subunit YajC
MTALHHIIAMGTSPGGQGQQSPAFLFVWMALMIGIFYIMLIRPQQRREKERRALIESVKSGDRVLFSGGIIGTVTNVKDKVLTVKVADKVKLEITRGAVNQVLEKGAMPEADAAA